MLLFSHLTLTGGFEPFAESATDRYRGSMHVCVCDRRRLTTNTRRVCKQYPVSESCNTHHCHPQEVNDENIRSITSVIRVCDEPARSCAGWWVPVLQQCSVALPASINCMALLAQMPWLASMKTNTMKPLVPRPQPRRQALDWAGKL